MRPRKRPSAGPSPFAPSRQKAAWPQDAKAYRCLTEALGRNLKRELARLDCGIAAGMDIKPVFDGAHVAAGGAIADALASLGIAELEILRLPLWPELASTQILVVLQILSGVAKILDAAGG